MRDTKREHPTWRRLVDHHDGVLSGTWRARTQAHLSGGCGPCEGALHEIATLQSAILAGPLPAPPKAALKRARRLFAARRVADAIDRVRTLVGRLVFDQRTQLVPALRASSGTERRLLWNLGEYELFVTATRHAESWELQGQFLPSSGDPQAIPGGWVALRTGSGQEVLTDLDAQGVFLLTGLPAGAYALDAELDGVRGHVPAFTLD